MLPPSLQTLSQEAACTAAEYTATAARYYVRNQSGSTRSGSLGAAPHSRRANVLICVFSELQDNVRQSTFARTGMSRRVRLLRTLCNCPCLDAAQVAG